MPTSYNQITGQRLERLAALSDGIFAVAMTLLVLDLRVPAHEVIHSPGGVVAHPRWGRTSAHQLPDELHDPGHFLERAAGAIKVLYSQ